MVIHRNVHPLLLLYVCANFLLVFVYLGAQRCLSLLRTLRLERGANAADARLVEAFGTVEVRTQVTTEVEVFIATLAELIMGLQVFDVSLLRLLEEGQFIFKAADVLLPRRLIIVILVAFLDLSLQFGHSGYLDNQVILIFLEDA